MNTRLQGGCACGAVRYEVRGEAWDAGWCHCRTCQLSSGAPAMAFASARVGEYVFTRGEDQVRTFASSSFGHRLFCGACGTPLGMKVNHQPATIDFSIATLDEPDKLPPSFHIFWSSKVAWFKPGDDLPRHDKFRPGTVGLDGSDPPA